MYTPMTNEPTHTQQIVDWRTGEVFYRQVTGEDNSVKIPPREALNIDPEEVAKIKAERDELYARIYPNRVK